MTDPFDVLRRPDGTGAGGAAIDPGFRHDLLAEARHRLRAPAEGATLVRTRPRRTVDTPTPSPMETIPMSTNPERPPRTRSFLLAAASVVLVAAGITAIVALNGSEEPDPPSPAANPAPTTAPASTARPETLTTTPSSTPSSTTTTAPFSPDEAIATAMLLPDDEYLPEMFTTVSDNVGLGPAFDPDTASDVAECAQFLPSVFLPIESGAHVSQVFWSGPPGPSAAYVQFVVVLRDEAEATGVFDAISQPDFRECATAHDAAIGGDAAVGTGLRRLPEALRLSSPAPAPFPAVGDQTNYYAYPLSWTDEQDEPVGPFDFAATLVRVGRSVVYLDGPAPANSYPLDVSNDRFHDIATAMVSRANAALGLPTPPDSSAASTSAPSASDARATTASLLVDAADFGPEYTLFGQTLRVVSFDPALSSQCDPYVDSVFAPMAAGTSDARLVLHSPSNDVLMQHVTLLPDDVTATRVFEAMTDPAFWECARTHTRMFDALKFATAIDPPPDAAGRATWFRYTKPFGTGTHEYLAALLRVGRTISYVDVLHVDSNGDEVTTEEEFAMLLDTAVTRAEAAL